MNMDGIRSAQLGSQVVPLPVGLFFACLTKNANPKDPKKKKKPKKKVSIYQRWRAEGALRQGDAGVLRRTQDRAKSLRILNRKQE